MEKQLAIQKENLAYEALKLQAQSDFSEACIILQPLYSLGVFGTLFFGRKIQQAYSEASRQLTDKLMRIEQTHYENLCRIEFTSPSVHTPTEPPSLRT